MFLRATLVFLRIPKSSKSVHKSFQNVNNWKLDISTLSQKYLFHLVHHLLASEIQMVGVTGMASSQARTDGVKHLKECSEETDEEHHHID